MLKLGAGGDRSGPTGRKDACIKRLLEVLCKHLGETVDEMTESLINDEEAASAYASWLKLWKTVAKGMSGMKHFLGKR